MDSWIALKNSKKAYLVKIKFYNPLNNCASSDKNYEHALNVWKAFKLNTMTHFRSRCFIIGLYVSNF